MTNEALKNYILRLSSYGGEPLWILIGNALEEKLAETSEEVIECIFSMCQKGWLSHTCYSTYDDHKQIPDELKFTQLEEYAGIHRESNYADYPETAEEFYFETTEDGEKVIPEDYYLPGWLD